MKGDAGDCVGYFENEKHQVFHQINLFQCETYARFKPALKGRIRETFGEGISRKVIQGVSRNSELKPRMEFEKCRNPSLIILALKFLVKRYTCNEKMSAKGSYYAT